MRHEALGTGEEEASGIRHRALEKGEEQRGERPKRERGLGGAGGSSVEANSQGTEAAIEMESVTFAYPGAAEPAVEGVTLRVARGERLGILGPNGGGKTTLIKLVLGLLTPGAGTLRVCGLVPDEARKRRLIGYVPQRSEAELAFPLSVEQVVAMGTGRENRVSDRVNEALEVTGALAYARHPIGTLSGGQVQRVMIARALAAKPSILVMDEPTVGVDPAGQIRFGELMQTARERFGLTIVIVSHDVKAIAASCDQVACLSRTLHSHTAPAGLSPEVLAEVFEHDVAAVFGDIHVHAHHASDCTDPSHGDRHSGHAPKNHGGSASEKGPGCADH
jgi:zinc transport system ATP-binding protein